MKQKTVFTEIEIITFPTGEVCFCFEPTFNYVSFSTEKNLMEFSFNLN